VGGLGLGARSLGLADKVRGKTGYQRIKKGSDESYEISNSITR